MPNLLLEECYEDWAEGPREELRALHLSLLVDLARLYESRSELEAAIEALEQVVSLEPMREQSP